ncbi:MAG TPA: FliG C-terminal domain-containing protein [bacterium]|nr:FliG C-terminal domain-containing protein [bacterium]
MRKIFIFVFFVQSLFALSVDIEEKRLAIENEIESKITRTIGGLIGDNRVVTVINLYMEGEAIPVVQVTGTEEEAGEEFALPGVPVEKKLTSSWEGKDQKEIPARPASEKEIIITRAMVRILLPVKVEQEMLKLIQDIAVGIARIDVERGDRLIIKNGTKRPFNLKYFTEAPRVLLLLLGLILVISLMIIIIPAQRLLVSLSRFLSEKASSAAAVPGPVFFSKETTAHGTGAPSGAGMEKQEEKKELFAFLKETDLRLLASALEDEESDLIVVTLHYLSPESASEVLSLLPDNKRLEVVAVMKEKVQFEKTRVEEMDARLQAKVSFSVGGDLELERLLRYAAIEKQEKLLSSLGEIDASLGTKMRGRILKLEDLAQFKQQDLMRVYQGTGQRPFAAALKVMSEENQDKILKKFVSQIRDLLKEELSLLANIPNRRLYPEVKSFLEVLYKLYEDGEIEKGGAE